MYPTSTQYTYLTTNVPYIFTGMMISQDMSLSVTFQVKLAFLRLQTLVLN